MPIHLRHIRALLLRAGWPESQADARMRLLVSMGARVLLLGMLSGCGGYGTTYLRPRCADDEVDRGAWISLMGAHLRRCERAEWSAR